MTREQELIPARLAAQGFSPGEIAGALGVQTGELPARPGAEAVGPLRALYFSDKREHRAGKLPGSFWVPEFTPGGRTMLWFYCPSGSGALRNITVGHLHKPASHAPSWRWNGSVTEPTLSPSVNCRPVGALAGWHGWLRNGYWEAC